MNVLFIGPSGSGKDTQAEKFVANKGYLRVSTGDLLRLISEGDNEIHRIVRLSMQKGFLSDSFVFGLLQIYIEHIGNDKVIFSGVVRRFSQIDLLDFVLFKSNKKLDKVVYFELSDEIAIERMSSRVRCSKCLKNSTIKNFDESATYVCQSCGGILTRRQDDNPESIKARLSDFHKHITEILEEYHKRNILFKVDASKSPEEVYKVLSEII
ncbi:hypothetical protein D6810_03155 [Candidatus Dojkabacteria bacterium]|uniref:Adenylate kinase n=1 Tax=Candidatus Dojkabacteria bacterium TaxID=2099670 RepID=A0A3M0YZK9_9BACT|nr:MAG: hypothetical protein D6810_03155 [Candidatus Dojkabacteria bacterium]